MGAAGGSQRCRPVPCRGEERGAGKCREASLVFFKPPPLLSGCNGVRGENLKTKLFFFVK